MPTSKKHSVITKKSLESAKEKTEQQVVGFSHFSIFPFFCCGNNQRQ